MVRRGQAWRAMVCSVEAGTVGYGEARFGRLGQGLFG
jgi:hypothetical protein